MSKKPLFFVLAAWVAVLAFISPPGTHAQDSIPRFEISDCPIDVPDEPAIDCGYLTVPEDHADPAGAAIQLPVIIVHSRSPNPTPDPILFTEGGPGFSSLGSVWWVSRSALVDERDAIILEQRGNLYARPSLACDTSVLGQEAEGDTGCLDSLQAQGIDLTHYTIQQIVADIEALRQALNIEMWNLYGTSFSTRLMLLTMQQYPEKIRSAILDSVLPPDGNRYEHDPEHSARSLQKLFDDCAANAACAAAYPELGERFYKLFSRLNDNPVSFTVAYDRQGHRLEEPFTEEVSGYTLLGWMVSDAFYGPAYAGGKTTYLPLLIDQVEAGSTRLLYPWLVDDLFTWFSSSESFAWGLYFAVNCQSDFPGISLDAMETRSAAYPELEGYLRYASEVEVCTLWDLPAAPLDAGSFASDVPTLVLAGGYDPVTPPVWGRGTAESLGNAYYYEFPAAGHGVAGESSCAQDIRQAFLTDPENEPDGSCVADEPDPEFVLPGDVLIAPGFYHTIYDIDLGNPRGKPWLEAVAVGALLLFIVEIGFLAVAGIVRLARRRGREAQSEPVARIAHPLAGVASVLGLSVPFLMSDINNYVLDSNPILLYFGLPADYPPVYVLGFAALAFAILSGVFVVFTILAWARRYWSLRKRGLFSLFTLMAVVFTTILVRWGLVTLFL